MKLVKKKRLKEKKKKKWKMNKEIKIKKKITRKIMRIKKVMPKIKRKRNKVLIIFNNFIYIICLLLSFSHFLNISNGKKDQLTNLN